MLINNENDMFLHTHLFNNTKKVNRAKRGALRLILGGARPIQVRNLERGPLTMELYFSDILPCRSKKLFYLPDNRYHHYFPIFLRHFPQI